MSFEGLCPVCGYNILENLGVLPWTKDSPSDEICPSCGIQFGYQDMVEGKKNKMDVYDAWRKNWIKNGMAWHFADIEVPPVDWNPKEQLMRIGVRLVDESNK